MGRNLEKDAIEMAAKNQRILENGPDIDSIMRVGKGHLKNGKSIEENMRADCFEALVAAVYLTYGLDEARRLVSETVL